MWTSEDYDFYMETYFNGLRITMLVTLVAHVVPGKPFAQSALPNTTQNAPARPSKGDDDWARTEGITNRRFLAHW